MYDEKANRSKRNGHTHQKQAVKTLTVNNRNAILIQA